MKLLDAIPYLVLVAAAILFGLAPFGATPHLIEKWRMLFAGTLRRPLDWFDFVLHSTPIVLLLAKAVRTLATR